MADRRQAQPHTASSRFANVETCLSRVPLPPGEGGAKRRVRARMPKHWAFRPHPAPFLMLALSGSRSARATFSRREKDFHAGFPAYFGQLWLPPRTLSATRPSIRGFHNVESLSLGKRMRLTILSGTPPCFRNSSWKLFKL